MVRSGNVVEVYEYERGFIRGYKGKTGRNDPGETKEEFEGQYRDKSIKRARREIRRLCNANVNQYGKHEPKFLTLTYSENMQDEKKGKSDFEKFIKRLNYRLGIKVKYLAVAEHQKRGALHYHVMLFNVPYIKDGPAELAKVWGHGYVKLNKVKEVDNLGAYMCKYLSKEVVREKGKKMYFRSRGLYESEEFTNEKADQLRAGLHHKEETYSTEIVNEYLGKIKYTQYIIADR